MDKKTLMVCLLLLAGCKGEPRFYQNLMKSEVFYQNYSNSKIDFVWMLDDSASMSTFRTTLANKMGDFIARINQRKAVDFRMVFTTSNYTTMNGNLLSSGGKKVIVSSATAALDASSIINTISPDLFSVHEQGLEQVRSAIESNKGLFLRDDAELAVVFVSDDDDFSCSENCSGDEPEHNERMIFHPVGRYASYLKNLKRNKTTSVSVFPIVGLYGDDCATSWGVRYTTLSRMVGGVSRVGNVCGTNFQKSLDAIAATIGDRGTRFPLQTQASGDGIEVVVEGTKISYSDNDGYVYDPTDNSIVFSGTAIPRNGALIIVTYYEKH